MTHGKKITIIGAGLGGCFIGILLAKQGHKVLVLERREDPRIDTNQEGRSINMTLSLRGIKALESASILEKILPHTVALYSRMVHEQDGTLITQRYGKNEHEVLYSIKRKDINLALLNHLLAQPNVTVRFNEKCVDVDVEKSIVATINEKTGKTSSFKSNFVIGADGAGSMLRKIINSSGVTKETMEWGYKEVILPSIGSGKGNNRHKSLHIWPRKKGLLLALPNQDKSFTCTLVLPFKGTSSFESLKTEAQIRKFFLRYYPDVANHISSLVKDFVTNPVGKFITIRTPHWFYKDKVVLLGDSVHAVFPFYGQGMNSTFEDCVVLAAILQKHRDDLESAFNEYQLSRKVNTDALSQLSRENFYELRDGVASLKLIAKREVDILLNKIFPFWLPIYTMIAHTSIPYAEAVKRAKKQDRVGKWLGVNLLIEIKALQLFILSKTTHS